MTPRRCALPFFTFVLAASALAADLEVKDAWVRGTVPAQKATGAFMQLSSKSGVTLTGVSSTAAGVAEIHEMAIDGNTMRMRPLPRLEVPAGQVVELKPGGFHIMLMELKQPLAAGATVPLTLQVEAGGKRETVELRAEVRSLTGQPAHGRMHSPDGPTPPAPAAK
jgi:periplasmic copper chaperone A